MNMTEREVRFSGGLVGAALWLVALAILISPDIIEAAKERNINKGICDKAKTTAVYIVQDRAQKQMVVTAYWELLDLNKNVIDGGVQTSFTTNYTGTDKKGWNDMLDYASDFLKAGRVDFSNDDN